LPKYREANIKAACINFTIGTCWAIEKAMFIKVEFSMEADTRNSEGVK